MKLKWVLGVLGMCALLIVGAWKTFFAPDQLDTKVGTTLTAVNPAVHVDNQQCLECHRTQADQWQNSHHAKSMAPAAPQTVLGKFENTEFRHQGVTSRFFRQGEKFFVRTDGPDGKMADFLISYTFGVSPLQQYLIELPGGRLQALQIAWDNERKRWFHLQPKEKAPAGDVLHWTGNYQTANTMCIECHTTGFEKRFDAKAGTFDSRWKEVNVSCQACHGPGERHVSWARGHKTGETFTDIAGERFGLTEATKKVNSKLQVDVCAACHSRRGKLSVSAQPGQPRLDHYLPMQLTQGHFYPDGQQLDEVFVDASFRQSKMFRAGVACTDCHNPHTGKLVKEGNAVCLQCHSQTSTEQFSAAKGDYDSPKHHHHPVGSAGAQCVACHMPTRTYMQVQARPDHSLRVPRPELTLKIGTPNACNGCHLNKSAPWALESLQSWGQGKSRLEPHFGEVFAKAHAGEREAAAGLALLAADIQQSPIVRATALSALSRDASEGMPTRIEATRDADAEVRASAANSFENASAKQRVYALAPLLRDPVLAVRMAALRSLSSLQKTEIPVEDRPAFNAAFNEFISAQSESLDMPGAHLNLAIVYANTGDAQRAEFHYQYALKIDPDFTPARANLATLYNATARNTEAIALLKEGIKRVPKIGDLQYSLGLLLAEEKRLPEAAIALEKASQLLPQHARIRYNLGLALQKLGRIQAAKEAFEGANRVDPQDPAIPQALAILFVQQSDYAKAEQWARRWSQLAPGDPQVTQLLARIGSGVRR